MGSLKKSSAVAPAQQDDGLRYGELWDPVKKS